ELGIEVPGPPGRQDRTHGRIVDAEQVRDRREVGRQPDDRADVEVPVGPAVEAMADAGREGIVDRRMAERALDADRREAPTGVEAPGHPDPGVELEECKLGRRVVQVALTPLELLAEASRQRVEVDLQADAECSRWTEARPDTAVLCAGDRLVEV